MAHALETGRDNHGQQLFNSYMALVAIFKANAPPPPQFGLYGDLGYLKAPYLTFTMKTGCNRLDDETWVLYLISQLSGSVSSVIMYVLHSR